MARLYRFRLLNVFAESTFGGNPLCVFEDGRGLSDEEMLALARQFNLSETTFILPSDNAAAKVRIFTPTHEMPFAGHPALGTAQVVRALQGTEPAGDDLTLEFNAGIVPLTALGDEWAFAAPASFGFEVKPTAEAPEAIAGLLGLDRSDLLSDPVWIDTGAQQLLVPLRSTDAVRRAAPDAARAASWPASRIGRRIAYVFAFEDGAKTTVLARYFFSLPAGGFGEDPGTGSACANLGGWLKHTGQAAPRRILVRQGEAVGRPCHLALEIAADGRILVGGRVIELGSGDIVL